MPDLNPYISATALAANIHEITRSPADAAIAGGFAAWIYSLTGSSPYVDDIGNGRAKVYLSKEQIAALQRWLDDQVSKSLAEKEPTKVVYELGPALAPWALKYALPVGVALFLAGLITHILYVRYIR